MNGQLLVLDGTRSALVAHETIDAKITIDAADLDVAFGWTLKPEGLCRGDICVPVRGQGLSSGDRIDLVAVADALGQPLVVDSERGVAAIGVAARSRAQKMATLDAPDFSLPRVSNAADDDTLVSLVDFDRRKVLLLAWSSW